jgi:23S rRNA pseudouridine2604 synthase
MRFEAEGVRYGTSIRATDNVAARPTPDGPLGCDQDRRLRRCSACQWNNHWPRTAPCIHPILVTTRGMIPTEIGSKGGIECATMNDTQGVRVSKLLAERGLCSRREADGYIERGLVFVDGQRVTQLGTRAAPDAVITLAPEARATQARQATILIHKPMGYVSGQAEDGHQPAATPGCRPKTQVAGDHGSVSSPAHLKGLAPAGRLDIDSTGLLVLTQDGRVARQLIGDDSKVEKEYLVRVEGALDVPSLALAQPRPRTRWQEVAPGQGGLGQFRSVELRAYRRPQTPDPPHVRVGRPARHRLEAGAHRTRAPRRPAARPVAFPARGAKRFDHA